MIKMKQVTGPAVYVQATGVPVVFGEDAKVVAAMAFCDNEDVLGAVDTIYALRIVISGQGVAIHPYQQTTVGGAGNAWGEIAGAANLAGRKFTVIAQVE
jgi:hypothetical protein